MRKRRNGCLAWACALAVLFGTVLALRVPAAAEVNYQITTDSGCYAVLQQGGQPADAVTQAAPGEEVHVQFFFENCPAGMCPYYVLVNGAEVRGEFLNQGIRFTMPAEDVTIETVYVKQFTAHWDLTESRDWYDVNDPRVVLSEQEQKYLGTDMFEEFGTAKMRGLIDFANADPGGGVVLCFDLDRDGTWDVDMTHAKLLPGTNLTQEIFVLQMPAGCLQGTVFFYLRAPQPQPQVLESVWVTLERPDESYTAVDGIIEAKVIPDPNSHVTVSNAVWYNGDGIDGGIGLATPEIKPGRQYFAEFMLTADEGYVFSEDTQVYIVNSSMVGHQFWPTDPVKFHVSTDNVVTLDVAVDYPGTAPEPAQTPAPETPAQTPAPETNAPETNAPETNAPETPAPATEGPAGPAPATHAPEPPAPGPAPAPETSAQEPEVSSSTQEPETVFGEDGSEGLRRWVSGHRQVLIVAGLSAAGVLAAAEIVHAVIKRRRRKRR